MSIPKKILGLLFLLTSWLFLAGDAIAANPLTDNFDDGNLDGWQVVSDPDRTLCNAPWEIDNGRLSIAINQPSCTTNLMPNDQLWGDLGENYTIEMDAWFTGGTDHNVAFRFTPSTPKNDWYDYHFVAPSTIVLERVPVGNVSNTISHPIPNKSDPYHIKITVDVGRIALEIDGDLVHDYEYDPTTDVFPTGRFAFRAGTGADPVSIAEFDNLVVKEISDELNVPYFSQNDEDWGGDVYNHHMSINDNIDKWGCALTSIAMVLDYHGVSNFYGLNNGAGDFPDGTEVNPGTLNQWLSSQPDGYRHDGAVNWWAPLRIANKAKDASANSHTLEFKKVNTNDFTQVDLSLQDGLPDILRLQESISPSGAHYAVATGIGESGVEYLIRDPEFVRKRILTATSSLQSLNRYTPSNTNQSFIVIQVDKPANVLVTHENGLRVGSDGNNIYQEQPDSWYVSEKPLNGYGDNEVELGGIGWNEVGIPKPQDGNYSVQVFSADEDSYHIEAYMYDQTNDPSLIVRQNETVVGDSPVNYNFSYSQLTGVDEAEMVKQVDFDQMIENLVFARKENMIKSTLLTWRLVGLVRLAEYFYPTHPVVYEAALDRFEVLLDFYNGTKITAEGHEFLSNELYWLGENL